MIPSALTLAPHLACWRHNINRDKLAEVVMDADREHNFYAQNAAFRELFEGKILSRDGFLSTEAYKKNLSLSGFNGVRPALFDAALFDCAKDIVGDNQHIGPHGIGNWMLTFLPSALRCFFPDELALGRANKHVIGDGFEVSDGDQLKILPSEDAPASMYRVEDSKGTRGLLLKSDVSITRSADFAFRSVLKRFDEEMAVIGSSHIYSYDKFDFGKLEDAADNSSPLFGRATSVEMVLLFAPFVLFSLLVDIPESLWIPKTFVLYNKFYWNWRRTVFREEDALVLEQQRVVFKRMFVENWARFSKTGLRIMKFEQLDHVVRDLRYHGPVSVTGTSSGDNAHIRLAKQPFLHGTNKTNDQNSLGKQLISFRGRPVFLKEAAAVEKREWKRRRPFLGDGKNIFVGNMVVGEVEGLRKDDWLRGVYNTPKRVAEDLLESLKERSGVHIPLHEFWSYKAKVFHSVAVGDEIACASKSYHGAPRHDFVFLRNGDVAQLRVLFALKQLEFKGAFVQLTDAVTVQELEQTERSIFECPAVVELESWGWIDIDEVRAVASCVKYPEEQMHFIVRKKHEEGMWK